MNYLFCLTLLLLNISIHCMNTLTSCVTQKLANSITFNKLLNHENIYTQKLLYKYALVDLFSKNPHLNIKKFVNDTSIFRKADNPYARFELFIKTPIFYAALSHAPLIKEDDSTNKYSVTLAQTPITIGMAMFYSQKYNANIPEIYCPENLVSKPHYSQISEKFEELLALSLILP